MSNYYAGASGLGLGRLGQLPEEGVTAPPIQQITPPYARGMGTNGIGKLMALAGTLSMPVLAYHGYRRDGQSVWGAVKWGFFGSIVWPITLPIALAQGYGKKKVAVNRRRTTRRRRRTSRPGRRRRTSRRNR